MAAKNTSIAGGLAASALVIITVYLYSTPATCTL